MSPEAQVLAALIGRVKTLALTPPIPLAYREIPAERPESYIEVDYLPNEAQRRYLAGDRLDREGILQLSLCLPIGQFEIVYRETAAQIAAHFPGDMRLTSGATIVLIVKSVVGRGLPDGAHWRTPVSVYYRARG